MLLDIAEILDNLVADLPGNLVLQVNLGLIDHDDEPIQNFREFTWEKLGIKESLNDLMLVIADIELLRTGEEDAVEKGHYKEMVTIISRRLLLHQIISKRYVLEGIPHELLNLYAQSAQEGWNNRVHEIIHDLNIIAGKRSAETAKIERLCNEIRF